MLLAGPAYPVVTGVGRRILRLKPDDPVSHWAWAHAPPLNYAMILSLTVPLMRARAMRGVTRVPSFHQRDLAARDNRRTEAA